MKKITLIASALLVSLSMLATQLERVDFSSKVQVNPQKRVEQVAPQTAIENFVAYQAAEKTNEIEGLHPRRMAQQVEADLTTMVAGEVGVGRAKAQITPSDTATSLYYAVYLLNSEGNPIAYVRYFAINTVVSTFCDSYYILYYASQYGAKASGLGYTLPKGVYYFYIEGYPLDSTKTKVDTSNDPIDYAVAGFQITLDGSEYAIKDAKVEVGTNNKLTATWSNAAATLPTGSAYQVRVYELLTDSLIANSGYELTETTWSTPDTITIKDNTSYEVYINVWSPYGYTLGNPADLYVTVGTDPYAPTNPAVTTDDETMQATFTWKNTLDSIQINDTTKLRIYNKVLILDEDGNEYIFANGYNNTALETATSEKLPVGKFTWQILPFYVYNNYWNYFAAVKGPDFEITDGVAPVIDSVYLANITDTVVNLVIEVTDNNAYLTPYDLIYNVKGDILLENATLEEDGTLRLAGLTPKLYSIEITATDLSGNVSDEYEFEFTPVKDEEAPKNLKAEIEEGNVFDKYVVISVSAEDNVATAEQLTYIVTFADGTKVELQATEGLIVLEGLAPETEYTITITVKDFGGNESTESVELTFTTVELIPIKYNVVSAQAYYEPNYSDPDNNIYNYTLFMYNYSSGLIPPVVSFDLYTSGYNLLSGTYNEENENLEEQYSHFYPEVYSKAGQVAMSDVNVSLKFMQNVENEGNTYHMYYIEAEWTGADENLYYIKGFFYVGVFHENDQWVNDLNDAEVFTDTDAPEIWLYGDAEDGSDAITVEGTTVEIMFGAYDGPFYFEAGDPVQTEITNLTLEVVDTLGNVLASQAAGTIENTPTLDEDGAYYFTATLTGLEANTEYVVYITAADEAGNEAEPIEVTFTTGEETGLFNLNVNDDAEKFIRDGHLYIKRGTEIYDATGIRVAK